MSLFIPELWPEPGVRAVKIGVHLEVVLQVLLHLCLGHQLTMLDNYHTLKRGNIKQMDNIPLGIVISQLYLDFVLERLLMGRHELHVRPFALNIALKRTY